MTRVNIKKNHFGILVLLTAMSFILLSCSKDKQSQSPYELGNTGVCVYTEMLKVDLEYGSRDIAFPLYFVSDSLLSEEDIAFVRFEGENVDYFESTKLNRLDNEEVTDVKINGKYLYVYDVVSEIDIDYFTPMPDVAPPDIWEIRIDNVVVSIDDKEYSIKLEHPVKYHYTEGYNDIEGNYMYGPVMVYTLGITQRYSVSIHNCAGDVVMTDLYFSDFLNATNKEVYYEGTKIGYLDGKTDCEVKQRESGATAARVYFKPAQSEEYTYTEFDCILCTAIVDYKIEGDDTVYRMKFPFHSYGMMNTEQAERFLEYVADLD